MHTWFLTTSPTTISCTNFSICLRCSRATRFKFIIRLYWTLRMGLWWTLSHVCNGIGFSLFLYIDVSGSANFNFVLCICFRFNFCFVLVLQMYLRIPIFFSYSVFTFSLIPILPATCLNKWSTYAYALTATLRN